MEYEGYGNCDRCKSILIPRVVNVSIEYNSEKNDDFNITNYFKNEWQRLFRNSSHERLLCCSKCSFAKRV